MSSLSAHASVFRPKYDEDYPPLVREDPEVVQLRKELDKVRHHLACRGTKVRELEKKFSELSKRADWLEQWKDKFKKKAENAEKDNHRMQMLDENRKTEIHYLECDLKKKNKELDDMKESRAVFREEHELQISRIERRHQKAISDLQDECDKNISTWVENNRKLEAEVSKLKENVEMGEEDYNSLNDRYRSVLSEVRELRETHLDTKWIGRSLKLKWIIDEMIKIGAVKLPDHEWATDMVQEIEFPNQDGNSVFWEVPRNIRDKYLPSAQDAHMDWVEDEDENELIRRLSEEARDFSNAVDNSLFASLENDRENTIKHIITIQKHIRGYLVRHNNKQSSLNPTKIENAIIIQKYWRRFYSSPIRYQSYSAFGEQAPGAVQSFAGDIESYRRVIMLVNTGCIDYQYRYIIPGRGLATERYLPAGGRQSISTYTTHYFHISMKTPGTQGNVIARKIRIPRILANGIGLGYYGSNKWVFDVHTGLCFHRHKWNELMVFTRSDRTIYVPTLPILLNTRTRANQTPDDPPLTISRDPPCNCERCRESRGETEQSQETDELDIQEIEDMQRAIRLSLLDMEIDYTESLNNMFQEPEEIHLNNDEEGLETLYDNFIEMGGLGGWTGTYDDY